MQQLIAWSREQNANITKIIGEAQAELEAALSSSTRDQHSFRGSDANDKGTLNETIIAIPTNEKIREAALSIHAGKAPGPDGFLAGFFTHIGQSSAQISLMKSKTSLLLVVSRGMQMTLMSDSFRKSSAKGKSKTNDQ
ncbi:unnamed protein product [Cochlearia groenlandica]